jgi:hypothetical protein
MTKPDALFLLQSLDAFYLDHRQCDELHQAVDDRPGGRIVLTCSCGVAMVRPGEGATELLQ